MVAHVHRRHSAVVVWTFRAEALGAVATIPLHGQDRSIRLHFVVRAITPRDRTDQGIILCNEFLAILPLQEAGFVHDRIGVGP
jgi:hypothetical protein